MNTLAAAGEADGIRVNAISPVAATRMLRRPVAPFAYCPCKTHFINFAFEVQMMILLSDCGGIA